MPLIGYARVSTTDQNLDGQIDALMASGVVKRNVYTDKRSGRDRERPALRQCLDALEEGDVLIVAKLDRLGRSMIDLVNIVQEISERGAQFKALDQPSMDTTTAGGELIFNLFATLAQYERRLIVERTSVGLEAARKRGRVGGRPKVTADHPNVVKVKELREKGIDVEDIGRMIDASKATVYRYLSM